VEGARSEEVAEAGLREGRLVIGLFNDAGDRLPVTYNSLTLNNPYDASDDTYELNTAAFIHQLDFVQDARQDADGSEAYGVNKNSLLIRLEGTVRAPSIKAFFDKLVALQKAFDPAKVSHENPTTQGFLALTFTTPGVAADVTSRYYVRARRIQLPPISQYTGNAGFFSIELLAIDPRRYHTTAYTTNGGGTVVNLGDYRTFGTVVITMAGAGDADFTYTSNPDLAGIATTSLVVDLSGCVNEDVVTIDMLNRKISKNGTETPTMYVSGDYATIEPGDTLLTCTNTTNATIVTTWYSAWCI